MSNAQISNDGPGRKRTNLERLSGRRAMLVLGIASLILIIAAISGVVYYLDQRSSQTVIEGAARPRSMSWLRNSRRSAASCRMKSWIRFINSSWLNTKRVASRLRSS